MADVLPDDLMETLATVRTAGAVTGAGISAESGVPTYRGVGGVYDDPEEGDRTVEALSGPTLLEDPDRTWRAVASLARRTVDARPNAAHEALVRMEAALDRLVILTQNVDGLHHQAGSTDVIDIHGDILAVRCMRCPARGRLTRAEIAALKGAPPCAACGAPLRPDAVLFEEFLPHEKVYRLQEAFYANPPDIVLVIGTTALFPYIAAPVLDAARAGRPTIEVNPQPTDLSRIVRWSLRGPAGTWVPRIADALAAD